MSDLDDLLVEPKPADFRDEKAKKRDKERKKKEAADKKSVKRSYQKQTFKAHPKGPYQNATAYTSDLDDLHKAFKQATPQELKDVAKFLKLQGKKKANAHNYGKFSK